MASFTDVAPHFNQYIQQQPVEAMVAVGTHKQQAYEQGVQKIQTQIDNIAGLDVVRDVDKAYLQSKLNQLGNNLRTVAAGDFSNFQLVNSVSGMTKQLTRDEGIQNAVASTAKYRKEIASMEEAEKAGKGSIANRWVFGKDSQDWLNSSDVKQAFSAKYTPYVDVEKKWMDTMKSLHSDLKEVDVPYERNSDGSLNYAKTAAAMQRLSKESVSADRIKAALQASMTPDDLNQLNISGRYTYRGHSAEALVENSKSKYNSQISSNNQRIKDLTGLANLSSSKPDIRKKALDSIDAVRNQNAQLSAAFTEESQYIMQNPEGAKGALYKNEAVNTFATANAWEHNKENLMTNPIKVQENWEKDYGMKVSEFKLAVKKENWSERMDVKNYDLKVKDYEKGIKELELKYGTLGTGGAGLSVYGGSNTNVKDPNVAMINEVNQYDAEAEAGIKLLIKGTKDATATQIVNALDKYQNGDVSDWKDLKKHIPDHLQTTANRVIEAQKNARRTKMAITNTINDVESSPEIKGPLEAINKKTATLKPIKLVGKDGRAYNFTQKEVTDFIAKHRTGVVETATAAIKNYFGGNTDENPSLRVPYTEKEKILARVAAKYPQIRQQIEQYKDVAHSDLSAIHERKQELISQKLLEKGSTYIPRESPIIFGSTEGDITRRYWESAASSALALYGNKLNEGGVIGGHEKLDSDDRDEALKWITSEGKSNIAYSRVYQGDNTYLQLKNKGKEILIPLTPNLASQLPADPGTPSYQTQQVVKAQALGEGYTNPTGKFQDSYFTHINMPRTNLGIGADLREDADNPNLNYIDFKLKTKEGIVPLTIGVPLDRDKAINLIQSMDDRTIKDAYLRSDRVTPEMKELVKSL